MRTQAYPSYGKGIGDSYEESETASIQSQPVALVSEKEYEYGADAFEIYMKENKGKIKPEMKEVAVQKNEKAR